jgi:hypothetical protein
MSGSRRHLATFLSALVMTAVMTLMVAASVVAKGPAVAHRVSAGGPDACTANDARPGCDGNFSLEATQYTDGSASGRYVDRFARGGGIIGVVDCVRVVDNQAWISGWITSGGIGDDDFTGLPFTTLVVDNGTSANQPPDQISSSHTGDPTPCSEMVPWENLFDIPQGQVTVD